MLVLIFYEIIKTKRILGKCFSLVSSEKSVET